MSTRKSIRDALLGAKAEFRKEVVEFNGVEVEIRQPSVKARKEIMKRATEEGKTDTWEFLIWAIIQNTYVKDTEEKVFEDSDYDVIVSKPVGGTSFVDRFGEVAADLMNIDSDVGEKAKNSKTTQKK